MIKKSIIYIDGSNFYFSIKRRFNCRIDIAKFCKKLINNDDLIKIKYYIAPVGGDNNELYSEQQKFIEKLRRIENLTIIFGRLEKRKREEKIHFIEKATDVNLALDLVLDAQAGHYDRAYLISNDGDFSGAIKAVIERFRKEIIYIAIGNPKTISHHLKKVSSKTKMIGEEFIRDIILD